MCWACMQCKLTHKQKHTNYKKLTKFIRLCNIDIAPHYKDTWNIVQNASIHSWCEVNWWGYTFGCGPGILLWWHWRAYIGKLRDLVLTTVCVCARWCTHTLAIGAILGGGHHYVVQSTAWVGTSPANIPASPISPPPQKKLTNCNYCKSFIRSSQYTYYYSLV